jgi:hypothetical protein
VCTSNIFVIVLQLLLHPHCCCNHYFASFYHYPFLAQRTTQMPSLNFLPGLRRKPRSTGLSSFVSVTSLLARHGTVTKCIITVLIYITARQQLSLPAAVMRHFLVLLCRVSRLNSDKIYILKKCCCKEGIGSYPECSRSYGQSFSFQTPLTADRREVLRLLEYRVKIGSFGGGGGALVNLF